MGDLLSGFTGPEAVVRPVTGVGAEVTAFRGKSVQLIKQLCNAKATEFLIGDTVDGAGLDFRVLADESLVGRRAQAFQFSREGRYQVFASLGSINQCSKGDLFHSSSPRCFLPNTRRVAPVKFRAVYQPDIVPVCGESLFHEVSRGRVASDDFTGIPAGAASFVV